MRNKIKTLRKKIVAMTAVLILAFTCISVAYVSSVNQAATSKPGAVKGLKKVKANKNSIKISFKKVKGAAGYQILIYEKIPKGTSSPQTPLVYMKTTKKTTYTIKNLVPGCNYTIKVRAYNKNKAYGKKASVKANTTGKWAGNCIVCGSCGASVPYYNNGHIGYDKWLAEHVKSVWDELGEYHSGEMYW